MSKTSTSASMFAHAASFRSDLETDPHKTGAQPAGNGGHRPVGGHLKRAIDVALTLAALMLLAPMLALIAVLLRVGLGRPILVAERHIGFAGQLFTAYTFRTSPLHGAREPNIASCLASFRDSKLFRLPQLLSILRGDMSFVGPRPVTRAEFDPRGYCAPDYFAAKPGLVGLGSGKFGSRRRAALERYYVRRWSVWLDLALLINAVAASRALDD